jgi:two-component system cell cycle response regulator
LPYRRRTDSDAGESVLLRALVVDDNPPYRSYLSGLLSTFGFTVTTCSDGAEALSTLSAGPFCHLLIVDCEMPGISGLGLISAVRTEASYSDAYALMLTGREDVETKVAALGLGFDDFLSKSAGEPEILAKISAARRLVARQKKLDEAVRELYGLATRDELTGLFNRRFFFSEAERLLEEGRPINLVFFDLDNFKRVNDTFGHLAGDRILRDIGSLFLRHTRHEDFVARYGGDEFVMLVTSIERPELENLVTRMVSDISTAQWTMGTETFGVGVTTGMACSSLLENPSVSQLLSAGDRDLYKNKWIKKNPERDPQLYEYDDRREGRVLDMRVPEDEGKERMEDEG